MMTTQPRQYRRAGWLCFAYLVASMVVLGVAVSSAMDFLHGGRVLAPSVLLPVSVLGGLIGLAGVVLLLLQRSRVNSNFRVAIVAMLFGLFLFGLAINTSLTHPAAPASDIGSPRSASTD